MLKKSRRLPVGSNMRPRVTSRSEHFTLKVFPGIPSHSRFSMALGKSAATRAVARNALKRTFFHFVEGIEEELPRHDFLVVAGKGSGELTKEKQREELRELFNRVH